MLLRVLVDQQSLPLIYDLIVDEAFMVGLRSLEFFKDAVDKLLPFLSNSISVLESKTEVEHVLFEEVDDFLIFGLQGDIPELFSHCLHALVQSLVSLLESHLHFANQRVP